MAPKRKAPVSSGSKPSSGPKASGSTPKPAYPPGSKRPALSAKKLKYRPPPMKKARVEVEYDDAPSTSIKGKGKAVERLGEVIGQPQKKKQPNKAAATTAPVTASSSSSSVPIATSKGKGKKQLAFSGDATSAGDAASAIASTSKQPRPSPKTFQIITGSYEKLLYGLSGSFPSSETPVAERDYTLKPIFIFPAHQACVKAVAASEGGKWLATGSTDEVVKIWDLRRRKEVGGLIQHSGSITSLLFPTASHLLTASEDATLALFRTRDWTMLRTFKGHTGRINSVAVHPTGKVALSVGHDRTMRMWDLMRGKAAGSTKIHKEGELVRFSPSGETLAILSTTTIDLFSKDMTPAATLKNPKRFHDFHFLEVPSKTEEGQTRELLLAACEEGYVRVFERVGGRMGDVGVKEQEDWREIGRLEGHTNRVKSLSPLYPLLSTISSDGFVYLYDLDELPSSPLSTEMAKLQPRGKFDTKGTRLTCVTMAEGDGQVKSAEVGDEEDSEGEDSEEEEEWGGVNDSEEEEGSEGELEEESEEEGEEEEEEE